MNETITILTNISILHPSEYILHSRDLRAAVQEGPLRRGGDALPTVRDPRHHRLLHYGGLSDDRLVGDDRPLSADGRFVMSDDAAAGGGVAGDRRLVVMVRGASGSGSDAAVADALGRRGLHRVVY